MMSELQMVAIGGCAAGFVQGLSGFAFSLIAMSLWAWTLSPQLAVPLAVFGALLGQILAAFSIRREIDGALLRPFIYGGLCGIPLGLWLLPHLNSEYFKLFLGGFLTLCVSAP